MKIITVIPIARGIGRETLSYFTAQNIPLGAIVEVPIRNKNTHALVIKSEDVEDLISELKNSSFAVKKVAGIKYQKLFTEEFIQAIERGAQYFAATTGATLNTLLPKMLFEEESLNEKIKNVTNEVRIKKTAEKFVLQNPKEDRIAHYKSLIREEFAKKVSVLLIVPTVHDAILLEQELKKGIEKFTVMLHGNLSKKKQLESWKTALMTEHSMLIISTPHFMSIPRHDIEVIIIEKESSRGYVSLQRPYLDFRIIAEFLAESMGARIIFGDTLLKVETLYRLEKNELLELSKVSFRSPTHPESILVDMKEIKDAEKKTFKILSEELISLIEFSIKKKERIFLFAVRRGTHPNTVCGDCGETVMCNLCSAPVVLYKKPSGNYFLCHHCGDRRSAEERCKKCNSWNLVTLGIGIERVIEEVKKEFPKAEIFKFDRDDIKNEKQAIDLIKKFEDTKGSILVGTEASLPYLPQVENAAIVSLDSLFSIPDFKINERILHILLDIKAETTNYFLIQTRNIEQKILNFAIKGNLSDFYREEIALRKDFEYPPFSVFIKATIEGKKKEIGDLMGEFKEMLEDYDPYIFPAFIATVRGEHVLHALIKIEREKWPLSYSKKPDQKLLSLLLSLSPQFKIKVDPESLL